MFGANGWFMLFCRDFYVWRKPRVPERAPWFHQLRGLEPGEYFSCSLLCSLCQPGVGTGPGQRLSPGPGHLQSWDLPGKKGH